MKLNLKQEQFCREYLVDMNATQAAIRAGYSKKTAGSQAHDLLKKPEIESELSRLMQERSERTGITADRVLQEIAKLAFLDPRKLFNDDGFPRLVHELDDDTAAAIAGLDVAQIGNSEMGVGSVLKYKLADKKGSLELLGKHLKLFTDKVDHDVKGGLSIVIETAIPRDPDDPS